MNLDGLFAKTTVSFDDSLCCDDLFTLNGRIENETALRRVSTFLDKIREMAGLHIYAKITSNNNFPTGTGIASSAAAFAALALAGSKAIGLDLDEAALSRLARTGSGSACRSIPGGFVEWQEGKTDKDSFAYTIASPEHWNLVDCVTVVKTGHKQVGSSEGHSIAASSPLQEARVADTPRRLDICRNAILYKDFYALAEIIEHDSNMMHAVMMTSRPSLIYWEPVSLALMQSTRLWRKEGIAAAYTLDAGPNVHIICEAAIADKVSQRLREFPGVQKVLIAGPGGPAQLIDGLT